MIKLADILNEVLEEKKHELLVQKEPMLCKFEKRKGKPTTIIEGYEGEEEENELIPTPKFISYWIIPYAEKDTFAVDDCIFITSFWFTANLNVSKEFDASIGNS